MTSIFDCDQGVKKQVIVLAITDTHLVGAYTSTFGGISDKLDDIKRVVVTKLNPNEWYPISLAEGKYTALAAPKDGLGKAEWVCLSQLQFLLERRYDLT